MNSLPGISLPFLNELAVLKSFTGSSRNAIHAEISKNSQNLTYSLWSKFSSTFPKRLPTRLVNAPVVIG